MISKNAYLNATPAQRKTVHEHLCGLLAILRAQEMSYQTSHWQSSGRSYYGNHLLFQRLYESVGAEIDGIAEKMVGYLGAESVNLAPQAVKVATFAFGWAKIDCPFHRGLSSEEQLQVATKAAYDSIKEVGAMTLGLDDFLMAMANAHETNAYLLQQVVQAPAARVASLVNKRFAAPSDSGAPSAEGAFRNMNPKFHETRQFAETGAITNSKTVAQKAAPILDISKSEAKEGVNQTPPTTKEILRQPGGKTLSTLNRALLETVDPKVEKDTGKRVKGATLANWTYLTPEGGWTHARRRSE